jgi:hypothetical protein
MERPLLLEHNRIEIEPWRTIQVKSAPLNGILGMKAHRPPLDQQGYAGEVDDNVRISSTVGANDFPR